MSKLVKLTDCLTVNPDHVTSVSWDRGHSYSAIIITTIDGSRHSIRHEPHRGAYGDCYAIEKRLLDA